MLLGCLDFCCKDMKKAAWLFSKRLILCKLFYAIGCTGRLITIPPNQLLNCAVNLIRSCAARIELDGRTCNGDVVAISNKI